MRTAGGLSQFRGAFGSGEQLAFTPANSATSLSPKTGTDEKGAGFGLHLFLSLRGPKRCLTRAGGAGD